MLDAIRKVPYIKGQLDKLTFIKIKTLGFQNPVKDCSNSIMIMKRDDVKCEKLFKKHLYNKGLAFISNSQNSVPRKQAAPLQIGRLFELRSLI